jgi:uncharacterized protein (TIGR00297 family)
MPFTIQDGLLLFASILGIGGLLGVATELRRRGWHAGSTRRVVHVGVGGFVATTPWLFSGPGPVCVLAVGFVLLNGTARIRGWWPSVHAARPESWGTVALPLAVLPAAAGTWAVGPDRILAFQAAFLVVAVADPLAGWVGEYVGGDPLLGTATREGTGAFAAATGVLVGGLLAIAGESPGRIGFGAALTAGGATAVEALSQRGWDNLFVVCAVSLVLVPLIEGESTVVSAVGAVTAGMGFAGAARWTGALTTEGAVGGGLFAASLVGLGGVEWILPGLAFFVLSSALSRLPRSTNAEEAGARSLGQVLANGGVAGGMLFVYALAPGEAAGLRDGAYVGFLGALAAAAADTWATELGTRYGGPPWSLREWKQVARGTSGAVSVAGTGAGILGALSVAGAAVAAGGEGGGPFEVLLGIVTTGGLVGMLVDSVAGATIEIAPDASTTDRRDGKSGHSRREAVGLGNQGVNLLGTAVGALVAAGLWAL